MKRIFYKDGTFKDVPNDSSWEYENDPNWLKTEPVPEPPKTFDQAAKEGYKNAMEGKS